MPEQIANGYYQRLTSSRDEERDFDDELLIKQTVPFSWLEYYSFFAVGLSMMWTWSMILQAVPYFLKRFSSSPLILRYFQASNLVVFAVSILATTVLLNAMDFLPGYAKRLQAALFAYITVGGLLTISTLSTFHLTAVPYFAFLQLTVLMTAVANGISQNSAFAFVANFGRTEYAPAIMTGEALAALLPSVIEILAAFAFPSDDLKTENQSGGRAPSSATLYFASSVIVGLASISSLAFLHRRSRDHGFRKELPTTSNWKYLWRKLKYPALANFSCLCISAVSPVFAARITSTKTGESNSILAKPDIFIPLAIVLWNVGDLAGSLVSVTSTSLLSQPSRIFQLSLARLLFIPLYLMCNIDGHGSVFGDWFYLFVVQFLFGLSHGWLSGVSMMGVAVWVEEGDREGGGAFMGMVLVAGLVAGSVLGVAAAKA